MRRQSRCLIDVGSRHFAGATLLSVTALLVPGLSATPAEAAQAAVGQGFTITASDLSF